MPYAVYLVVNIKTTIKPCAGRCSRIISYIQPLEWPENWKNDVEYGTQNVHTKYNFNCAMLEKPSCLIWNLCNLPNLVMIIFQKCK